MTSFKQYLAEAASSSAMVNVTKFTLDTLLACHKNAGYEYDARELRSFIASKYDGFKSGHHVFNVLCRDDENEGDAYITKFIVEIGKSGMIEAETSAMPHSEGTMEAMKKKFESL